jgi:hypothetical protein
MSEGADNVETEMIGAGKQAAYQFTLRDKIHGALADVKIRVCPREVLVAGPYVGEFGHELMDWQPWVRAQVPRYREVHVITYPGRDCLYPGCRVHYHEVKLEHAGYKHGRFSPERLTLMAHEKARALGLKNYDVMTALNICTRYHQRFLLPAKYELLGVSSAAEAMYDLAFHFRMVKKTGPDQIKNYTPNLCDEVTSLCRRQGWKFFCIGHPRYAYCPAGVEDRRSENLSDSIAALRVARLLVGEQSGPLHLAQLTGTAILTWSPHGRWAIDNFSAKWNVFNVPIYMVTDQARHPSPDEVEKKIVESLADLRCKTDEFSKPAKVSHG